MKRKMTKIHYKEVRSFEGEVELREYNGKVQWVAQGHRVSAFVGPATGATKEAAVEALWEGP